MQSGNFTNPLHTYLSGPGVFSSVRVFVMTYEQFYKTKAWLKCREAFLKYKGGLCERCFTKGLIVPAVLVHHKQYLNDDTVNDPELALNFDNLEALCWSCHEQEHQRSHKGPKLKKRFFVDSLGRVHIAPHAEEN